MMITVCMATYNGEKYIEEQLNSILSQISLNDELVISDDGSNDNTKNIINRYQKKYSNIKLIDGPQKGVIKNFENALSFSKGDIIFLSDQDDIWAKEKVDKVLNEFNDPNTLLVLHDAEIIDKNGKVIEKSFYEHRGSKKGFINNIIKNSYIGCCMAFRKQLLNVSLPFPKEIEMHDWWLGLMAEQNGEISMITDKLIKYRRHGDNVSSFHHHPLKKMVKNRLYFIRQIYKRNKKVKK